MMRKITVVLLLFLVAVFTAWFIFSDGTMSLEATRKKLLEKATDAVAENADPGDVAALALKAINLTQGEKGVELWRLKADWGNMRRSDNIMELEKPKFTYYMPPNNDEVHIASLKGDIDQRGQQIRFLDSVVITHADRTLTSDRVVYLGKTREMVFPDGALISSEDFDGKAARVVWLLNDKVITATGGIDITFKDVEKEQPVSTPTSSARTPRRVTTQG